MAAASAAFDPDHTAAGAGTADAPAAALRFAPELLLRAQGRGGGVRAAIFDVDGVLTDGQLYIGEAGEAFKAFHVLDGHGVKLIARHGIVPLVITGRDAPALRRRLADLGVLPAHACFGVEDKLAAAEALRTALGLHWDELAAIGDDWPDLPLLQRVALAVAPPNAHPEVLARAHHVTRAGGGRGAAREFCDLLLQGAGRYGAALQGQLRTLDGR